MQTFVNITRYSKANDKKEYYILGSWVCPLDELGTLVTEIKCAAECKDKNDKWELSFIKMSKKKFESLGEFAGY